MNLFSEDENRPSCWRTGSSIDGVQPYMKWAGELRDRFQCSRSSRSAATSPTPSFFRASPTCRIRAALYARRFKRPGCCGRVASTAKELNISCAPVYALLLKLVRVVREVIVRMIGPDRSLWHNSQVYAKYFK